MTPAEEILQARISGAAPAATTAPAATSAAPVAPAAVPSAIGGAEQSPGEQVLSRRVAGQPADDRSWWQRHITGEGGYEPDIQELGAAKVPPGADWQVYTLPLTTSDPQARVDILTKHIKDAKAGFDKYGNPVIELPGQGPDGKETKKFYTNRPGISEADIQGAVADIATSLPAARAFAGIRGVGGALLRGLGQMGTQAAREGAAVATGAETTLPQAALNTGLAGAGSIVGDVGSGLLGSAIGRLSPTAKESVVGDIFDRAKVDWKNIPESGRKQIMDRLGRYTPGQAETILKDPDNVQNLYRSALSDEFGPVTQGQIAGDARQIGKEAGRGFIPKGQTDEVDALLEQAQRKYWGTKLLDTEGKNVADLTPASISKRLDDIIKDPDAHNLFGPGEMAELRRGKDYADMLRKKGTPSGDITYQLLQQLGGRIPSLGLSLGAGALGFHLGGLPWAGMSMLTGGIVGRGTEGATSKALNSMLARRAVQPPPLQQGPIGQLGTAGGLLGSNLAVESRGMGLLDNR